MKHYSILSSILLILSLTGCIKDELPNIEVDILEVLSPQEGILNVVYLPSAIDVYADPAKIDPTNVTLSYHLSDGATIMPCPADVSDYSSTRQFTVTSEDGKWSKTYQVRIIFKELPCVFDFEDWYQPEGEKYKVPYALNDDNGEAMYIWSCGNEPYSFLTSKKDDYTAFPTQPTTEAYQGNYAAKLVTKLTGDYYKPMAAGNLFIGQFDASQYDPLKSTQFGLPFMKKPLRLVGKYKYRSGGKTLKTGMDDCCRIQAVLYKTDDTTNHLNGYTIKDSPNIIAKAEMTEDGYDTPGEGFAEFDLEFIYTSEIDRNTLKSGGYNLAIIFSASRNGDTYDGAENSTLIIDDVQVVCDPNF